MRHEYCKAFWVGVVAVGLAFASTGVTAWADADQNVEPNVYVETPDGQLAPKAPEPENMPDRAYTPDAVHVYRWDGGIYVEDINPVDPGVIGVQPDPATANVDPAEAPPGDVIVQEPVQNQELNDQ